jgi:hypothetical protein
MKLKAVFLKFLFISLFSIQANYTCSREGTLVGAELGDLKTYS